MLRKTIRDLLDEQINKELYSAYVYLSMADYYNGVGLAGFENWFTIQTQEERDHALLFRQYLLNSGDTVTLSAIQAPDAAFSDYLAPLSAALAHEEYITASIHNIYAAAHEARDFRTMQFLDWFVKEQAEEEKNVSDLIHRYTLFAGDGKGLYLLDQELAARVYAPPSLVL